MFVRLWTKITCQDGSEGGGGDKRVSYVVMLRDNIINGNLRAFYFVNNSDLE